MLVLGSGPGGYSAAFRAADLGMKTVLVERYASLGGVCLNVGCIPSKALLHTAAVMDEVKTMGAHGITLRRAGDRPRQAARIQGRRRQEADRRPGRHGEGAQGRRGPRHRPLPRRPPSRSAGDVGHRPRTDRRAARSSGSQKAIIAAGSEAVKLPFMPDDPRIVDSTGALQLPSIPKRMLVVGGGIIGLEMANVYSSLGARIDVVEMLDGVMTGADRDLVKVWEKKNAPRFDNLMLKTKTVSAEGDEGRHRGRHSKARRRRRDAAGVRHGARRRRAQPQRQGDRRAEGRRRRHRSRLHQRRQADAHERRAHPCDRRHRRPADARAQGGARRRTSPPRPRRA